MMIYGHDPIFVSSVSAQIEILLKLHPQSILHK